MSTFSAILARRHAAMQARFCKNADGQTLKVFFPEVPGPRATTFPTAVTCQDGQTNKSDRDLTGLLERKASSYSISLPTSDLPAAYRRGAMDTLSKLQILKVGYTPETATTYRVTTSSSASGITQIELETI